MRFKPKKTRSMSLGKKLLFSFLIILVLSLTAASLFAFLTSRENLRTQVAANSATIANGVSRLVDGEIQPKCDLIDYFISHGSMNYDQPETIQNQIAPFVTSFPDIESMIVTNDMKQFVNYPTSDMTDYDPTSRFWYQQAQLANGETTITSPYFSKVTNSMTISIAKTTPNKRNVASIFLSLEDLSNMVKNTKVGKSGHAFIITSDGHVVSDSKWEAGTDNDVTKEIANQKKDQHTFVTSVNGESYHITYVTNKLTGWKVATMVPDKEISDASHALFYQNIIVLVIASVIGGIIIWLITRMIARRLDKLAKAAEAISSGDLTVKVKIESNDEIGRIGDAFNKMRQSLNGLIQSIHRSADDIAASSEELTASAEETSSSTNEITHSISQSAQQTEENSQIIGENAEQLKEVNTWLQMASTSATNLAELSRNSDSTAKEGNELVQKAVNEMNQIDTSVTTANGVVQGLAKKSGDIQTILQTINQISDQTNLLALNAAIEAARAGESGKGFSVVAEEVRKLAEQSSEAAKNIEGLIREIVEEIHASLKTFDNIQSSVAGGYNAVQKTAENFRELQKAADLIATDLNGMNNLLAEVSESSDLVSSAMEQVKASSIESTQHNAEIAASAEEQLAAMEEVTAASESLAKLAEDLQKEIEQFKTDRENKA
nr:methyl-accepting chemotaxis protein [Listeria ilorinensis]